jgi:hypothetical protein
MEITDQWGENFMRPFCLAFLLAAGIAMLASSGLAQHAPTAAPYKGNHVLDSPTCLEYDLAHGEQNHERTKDPARSNHLLFRP